VSANSYAKQTEQEQWQFTFEPTSDPAWEDIRGSHNQLVGHLYREMPMLAFDSVWHSMEIHTRIPLAAIARHLGMELVPCVTKSRDDA
jgi:hypothetical protein